MKSNIASEPYVFAERAKPRAFKSVSNPEVAAWPESEERLSRRCRKMVEHFEKAFSFDASGDGGLVEDASRSLAALESAILAAPALTVEALRFKLQIIRRTPSAWRTPEETDDLLAILASDLERPDALSGPISQSAPRGR